MIVGKIGDTVENIGGIVGITDEQNKT